jgi:hypothetical protein
MEVNKMKNIRFGVEYCGTPLFCADIDMMGQFTPEDLGLPEDLIEEIHAWDSEFQETFCDEYPPDSGFHSRQKVLEHNSKGKELAQKIRDVLGPEVNITFLPINEDD